MIFDIITTHYAINSFGLSEGNPIMSMVTGSLLAFVAVKAFGTALILGIYRQLENRNKQITNIGKTVIVSMMLLVVAFNSMQIVSAESGTIEIVDSYDGTPYLPASDGASASVVYTRVVYAPSIVNYLDNFRFLITPSTSNVFESTQFTSSQGCSGYAWYDANTSGAYIVYSSRCYVNASGYDTLTYSKNIFSNVTIQGGYAQYFNPGVGKPVGIGAIAGLTVANRARYEDVQAGVSASDSYIVTYPISGYFNTTVVKNPSVNTRYIIERGDRTNYTTETTYNKISFSSINQQSAGIYINATLLTGAYSRVLVNSSGCGAACEEQESQTYPDDGANIYFDKTSYVIGDYAGINYYVANQTHFNLEYLIYENNILKQTVEIPENAGFVYYKPSSVGTLRFDIQEGIFFKTVIGTGTVSVLAETPSSIRINSSVPAGKNFSVSYKFGFDPDLSSSITGIKLFSIENSNQIYHSFINLPINNPTIVANTEYTENISAPVGSWNACLWAAKKGTCVANALFISYISTVSAPFQVQQSNISTRQATYMMGDTLIFDYQVDSVNYSNKLIYFNINNTGITTVSRELTGQIDNIEVPIINEEGKAYWNTYKLFWKSGTNNIQLRAKNATADILLAQTNFSLISTNLNGYSLTASDYSPNINSPVTFSYQTPDYATIKIWENALDGRKRVYTSTVNASGTFKYSFKKMGTYDVAIYNHADQVEVSAYIDVSDPRIVSGVPTTTPSPTAAGADGIDPMDALDSYVLWLGMGFNETSKLAFAIIVITVMGVIALWMSGGRGDIASIVVFAPYAFMTYIGYIPKWIFVIVVILTALALKIFR